LETQGKKCPVKCVETKVKLGVTFYGMVREELTSNYISKIIKKKH